MNKPSKIIVVFVIAAIGLGGVLYSRGYFEVLTPQTEIFIAEISVSYHQLGCYVSFNLVNSGDITAFVDIDISSEYLIKHNQYLVKANTRNEKNMWVDEISSDRCDIQNSWITISKIIKWYN